MKQKSSSTRLHVATAALLLSFGVAAAYAQPGQLDMTVSGTAAASAVNLQSGKPASEYQLAGDGNLGPFTLRVISAGGTPQESTTCSGPMKLSVPVVTGAAVARFENGDILKINLTAGDDCIDFAANQATCTRIFQMIGGTGRFKGASEGFGGTITLIMTLMPVLTDDSNTPVFFVVTGVVTGTMWRVPAANGGS